jgi:hypothetical protein
LAKCRNKQFRQPPAAYESKKLAPVHRGLAPCKSLWQGLGPLCAWIQQEPATALTPKRPTGSYEFDEGTPSRFGITLVLLALNWAWQAVQFQRQAAADQSFYAREVAPYLDASKRQADAWERAYQERQQGNKLVALPRLQTLDSIPLDQWIERSKERSRLQAKRDLGLIAIMVTAGAWMILAAIQGSLQQFKWQDSDRPAAASAGALIGELVESGEVFAAETKAGGVDAPRVEVDGARRVVTFRNYSFVTSFTRNPKRGLTEVPFADLIVGTRLFAKGRSFLQLRPAQGQVVIGDSVQPFGKLVVLLQDAAELNRRDADRFRDALLREPRVRTPWYGWAIIASALGGAGYAFWYLVVRR